MAQPTVYEGPTWAIIIGLKFDAGEKPVAVVLQALTTGHDNV
jgi:hypothetical protein